MQAEALKRPTSAPELTVYRDWGKLNIDSDFKTTMKEMSVLRDQAVSQLRSVMPSEAGGSLGRPPKASRGFPKPSQGPAKRLPSAEAGAEVASVADMAIPPKQDLFAQRVSLAVPKAPVDTTALAEVSRQAGIKYIVFPKQSTSKKFRKSERYVTSERLEMICKELNQPARALQR